MKVHFDYIFRIIINELKSKSDPIPAAIAATSELTYPIQGMYMLPAEVSYRLK